MANNKNKKPLTPTEKLRLFTILKWTTFGGEFVSAILPFIIIGLVNYKEYFVEYSGVKMSIAGTLTLGVMGFVMFILTSKKGKEMDYHIPLLIIWATVTFILFMLGQIITELSYIMLVGFFGILGAFGFDIASKQFDKKAKFIKNSIEKAEEELTKQAYISEKTESGVEKETILNDGEEAEKKRVRIKIKK